MIDSHVAGRNSRSSIVTPAAYLLFYRRRSDHALGGPLLAEVVTTTRTHEGGADSVLGSRDPSPSAPGEGLLGVSSRNGSSSAFHSTEAGVTRHMGGGGLAQRQGMSHEVDTRGTISHMEDDGLPEYTELSPDEGISMQEGDVPLYSPGMQQSWSFSHLGSIGAPHSQMTAVPPSSLDGDGNGFYTQEEDLFAADENASTQAEGGGRSSVELSDRDEDFVDAPILASSEHRGMRESAPPPRLDEAGESPVAEIRVDDVEEESHP